LADEDAANLLVYFFLFISRLISVPFHGICIV